MDEEEEMKKFEMEENDEKKKKKKKRLDKEALCERLKSVNIIVLWSVFHHHFIRFGYLGLDGKHVFKGMEYKQSIHSACIFIGVMNKAMFHLLFNQKSLDYSIFS